MFVEAGRKWHGETVFLEWVSFGGKRRAYQADGSLSTSAGGEEGRLMISKLCTILIYADRINSVFLPPLKLIMHPALTGGKACRSTTLIGRCSPVNDKTTTPVRGRGTTKLASGLSMQSTAFELDFTMHDSMHVKTARLELQFKVDSDRFLFRRSTRNVLTHLPGLPAELAQTPTRCTYQNAPPETLKFVLLALFSYIVQLHVMKRKKMLAVVDRIAKLWSFR